MVEERAVVGRLEQRKTQADTSSMPLEALQSVVRRLGQTGKHE